MGGLQVHNHAPSGPNLQVRTCKNSTQVEFQVGPEYGNSGPLTSLPVNRLTATDCNADRSCQKHLIWPSQCKYAFSDVYPSGSAAVDMFFISNISEFGPRGGSEFFNAMGEGGTKCPDLM